MTITAWRIVRKHLAATAFSGLGAKLYGGRWNSPGVPAVYCGGSVSLATLEMLTHLGSAELLNHYVLIEVAFDSKLIATIDRNTLPKRWRSDQRITRRTGDRWLRSQRAAVLRVPSAIVPVEVNYLLNPLSPDFSRISIGKAQPYRFDRRLK